MSALGPSLPPHLLAKRKRNQEEEAENEAITSSGAKRSTSPNDGGKRQRVMGPAMPPAPLEERPNQPPKPMDSDSEDDDDDFGPSMPPTTTDGAAKTGTDKPAARSPSPAPEKLKRDDWMTMPPQQDDLAARMDPSKIRARGFNTGKGAKAPNTGGGDGSSWHETAEQKQKRLQDEMMGVAKPAAAPGQQSTGRARKSSKEEAADARKREQIDKSRGPSLMDQHKKTKGPEAQDDDPSKRAFDREKDMSTGMRINSTQRTEMLKKAGGFSSKFSGGSYL